MENFRVFLRKTWNQIRNNSDKEITQELTRSFSDELKSEYAVAKAEWNDIDKKLINKMSVGTLGASAAQAIIHGGMDWKIPVSGFAIAGVINLLSSQYDRKRFKATCPLSVFIDLHK